MLSRFALKKLLEQIQRRGHKPQPIQDHRFHGYPCADLLMRILAQTLIDGLNHTQLIDNTCDDAQMVYGLDDDIDKTLSLTATLMRIITHYSEYDNPEGGMWDTLTGHTDKVLNVNFAPDGKTVVSASADDTLKVWQLDGTEIVTLAGHTDQVSGLAFQPSGGLLASADYDHRIILWNWRLLEPPVLDNLLIQSCQWVKDYLSKQSQISPECQSSP